MTNRAPRLSLALLATTSLLVGASCSNTSPTDANAPRTTRPVEPTPAAKPAPVPSIEPGTYRREHTVAVVCDQPDWCDTPVIDTLRVEQKPESLQVSIELVQANAHTCSFNGELEQVLASPESSTWAFKNAAGDELCSLELKASGDSISLTSEGCRYYCGARASLLSEFSAKPDDPDPSAYDCVARCKAVDVCTKELERPAAKCATACYNLEKPARDQFDDCVREAVDDCATILACL